jgi:hypothetical protein
MMANHVFRWILVLLTVIVALMGFSYDASAKGEPGLAKALYEEARQLKEQGKVRASLAKLEAAYEAYQSDAILMSIANRHLDLGEPEEALEVLKTVKAKGRKMRREVSAMKTKTDLLLARPVTVKLSADQPNAKVSVDDGPFESLPLTRKLPRGPHRFLVRLAKHQDVVLDKELRGSLEIPIFVRIAPEDGMWRVTLKPSESLTTVRVLLNGKVVAMADQERQGNVSAPRNVVPGIYRITCLKGVGMRADAAVEVVSLQTVLATCDFALDDAGSATSVWGWATAGAGAALAVTGAAFLVQHYLELPDLERVYPPPRYKIETTKPLVGGLLIGTGVVLGTVSALLFAEVFD